MFEFSTTNTEIKFRAGHADTIRAELTGTETACAKGITARGPAPVLALCRALVKAGHDPAAPLIAYRNTVLALQSPKHRRSGNARP